LRTTAHEVVTYRKLSIAAAVLAIIFSVSIALLVSRPLARRLAQVRIKAALLGAGDLTVRLDAKGNDEIDQLARTFNHMAQALSETRDDLVRAASAAASAN